MIKKWLFGVQNWHFGQSCRLREIVVALFAIVFDVETPLIAALGCPPLNPTLRSVEFNLK